jgi:hypothetical protein
MNTRDASGFTITSKMQRVMDINSCYASIMRADKKREDGDDSLPSGIPIPVLPVDYLKDHPKDWVGGEGSYVVPVDSDWGLWFNWTMNNPMNTSVLVSVKGMNPLTGQRMNGYTLEETKDECPIHKTLFKKGKLCTECGFKWPTQNFISAPNSLFLDGFRQADGTVRQFFFTEDMASSIPELVIGKEDTVPAFGFCFYKRKNYEVKYEDGKRNKNEFPEITQDPLNRVFTIESMGGTSARGFSKSLFETKCYFSDTSAVHMASVTPGKINRTSDTSAVYLTSAAPMKMNITAYADSDAEHSFSLSNALMDGVLESSETKIGEVKFNRSAEVGIGGGARIKQDFKKSLVSLEDWKEKPEGILRLYFVFQEQFESMVESGFNDLKGSKDGYLSNLPVGGKK